MLKASLNTLAMFKKKKREKTNGDFWNRGYIWNDPGLRIIYRSRLSFEKGQKLKSYKTYLLESLSCSRDESCSVGKILFPCDTTLSIPLPLNLKIWIHKILIEIIIYNVAF